MNRTVSPSATSPASCSPGAQEHREGRGEPVRLQAEVAPAERRRDQGRHDQRGGDDPHVAVPPGPVARCVRQVRLDAGHDGGLVINGRVWADLEGAGPWSSTTRCSRLGRCAGIGDVPVTDDEIEHCLTAAQQAPSGGNLQPWQYLVVTDPELRAGVGALYRSAYDRYERTLLADHPALSVARRRGVLATHGRPRLDTSPTTSARRPRSSCSSSRSSSGCPRTTRAEWT